MVLFYRYRCAAAGKSQALEAHGFAAERRDERRQEVRFHHIPAERLQVERRVNQVLDLVVCSGQLAPVQAHLLVVRSMVAVIEQEAVVETSEVARVVELRFFVGMNVLDIVDDQNELCRNDHWGDHVEQCLA